MLSEEQSEYIFTWNIKDFHSFYNPEDEDLTSPSFKVESIASTEWCLKLCPEYYSSFEDESCISVYLDYEELDESENVIVSYSLEIMDENHCAWKYMQWKNRKFDGLSSPNWECSLNVTNDELEEKFSSWAEDVLTIRCRMKIDNQRKQKLSECTGGTAVQVAQSCVEWCVAMPSLYEHSEKLAFKIEDWYDFEIALNCTEEKVTILIHCKSDELPQQVTCTFFLFDKIGYKLGSKRVKHIYISEEPWEFPNFITKELLKSCVVNSFMYEFKLMCEVKIPQNEIVKATRFIERVKYISPHIFTPIRSNIPQHAMQSNFCEVYNNKTFSDAIIRCNNHDFPVHKLLLKVQSPVLADMFDQGEENKMSVVDLTDMDVETLKFFLKFLYTATVDEMDYEMAKNLMLIANRYQVPLLVDECATFLKSILSTENVCEIITLADSINCEDLKSYALRFIKVNASKILQTSQWVEWIEGNIKLATYILSKLSATISTCLKLI